MEYKGLVEVYSQIEATSKRLEKTSIISSLLKKTSADELPMIMLLLEGRVFPRWDARELGVAERIVIKAISTATGISSVEDEWKKSGDLGKTAEMLVARKRQATLFSAGLTVKKVFENIKKVEEEEGEGTVDRKIALIAELLTSASPAEARYIVRTVLGELRAGIGEGSIRDAIVWAFFVDVNYNQEENELDEEKREEYAKYAELVQEAYNITNDFSTVALLAKTKGESGLLDVPIAVGKPLKVMLYQKARDMADAFEQVGKPCACEYKYDGFRLSIHRKGAQIWLYTRRLEDVTKQFPDVVEVVRGNINADDYIIDAEVIGIDALTKKWLPFQNISQRIKRKYDILKMIKDIPVMVNAFDAVQVNGRSLLKVPFIERRKILESAIIGVPEKINLAKEIITSDEAEAQRFYEESLAHGNEGMMMKRLDAPYKPGSRVGYGIKVKPVMENLDLVIVGAEWGEGKRAAWLSSFTLACMDENGNLLEIGKVGTGIKEKNEGVTFLELTNLIKPLVIGEKGKEVKIKPSIVVEVSYEEIQKSPTYSSGYALRFPRMVRIRNDKNVSEASSLGMIEGFYEG